MRLYGPIIIFRIPSRKSSRSCRKFDVVRWIYLKLFWYILYFEVILNLLPFRAKFVRAWSSIERSNRLPVRWRPTVLVHLRIETGQQIGICEIQWNGNGIVQLEGP